MVDLTLVLWVRLSRKTDKILKTEKSEKTNKISFSFATKGRVKAMFLNIQHLRYRKTELTLTIKIFSIFTLFS